VPHYQVHLPRNVVRAGGQSGVVRV
jgi:hypothetical protein